MRLSRVPPRNLISATPLLVLLAITGCNVGKNAKDSAACPETTLPDGDGDGYVPSGGADCEATAEYDCDDDNPSVHPDAAEVPGNGQDDDCDGETDEIATDDRTDADGDGYSVDEGDCDDISSAVNPDAAEVCDGVDNNCDGGVDEGVLTTYYGDADGDGFGDAAVTQDACEEPEGYSSTSDDPNDTDASIFPGSSAHDDDGDGYSEDQGDTNDTDPLEVPTMDDDGDGFSPLDGDCNDSVETVYPSALEACDERDNDCDGSTDEDSSVIWFPTSGSPVAVDYTADLAAGTSSAPAALNFSEKGTLHVCPGTWYVHFASSRDLSIIGIDEGRTILNGGGNGRVVTASSTADLNLTKLTITGGDASTASPAGYGGGVFIQYGDATLDEVTLSFNKAAAGGGIGTDSVGDGVMTNVTLFGNEARYGGGAHLATATMNSTTFEDNVASSGNGGGLYATFVEIENSTFTNNSATGSGGAAYIYSGTITGTTFDSNLATTFGGALSQYSGNLEVSSSAFTNNTASSGGAFYSNASTLELDAVEMTDNAATSGAGLFAQSTGLNITGSTISTNRAYLFGGAVYGLYSTIEVEDSDVSGNSAGYGGAFFMDTYGGAASTLTLGVDTVVSSNTATHYGGAILGSLQEGKVGPLEIIIDGASINHNQAQRGGAIATGWYYGGSPSKAVIICTSGDIVDNTASMGMGDGAHLNFGAGASLVSTGCVWGSDQEIYVANITAASLPSSFTSSSGFTCDSAGCR